MGSRKPQVDPAALLRTVGEIEPGSKAPQSRDLNEVVHSVLIIGLYASVLLMVAGVAIDLIRSRALPTEVLSLSEAWSRTIHLRASGYFSLGLLILILTPLLRVIGSFLTFLWQRDWRYVGVTLVVMVVMLISLWVGKG